MTCLAAASCASDLTAAVLLLLFCNCAVEFSLAPEGLHLSVSVHDVARQADLGLTAAHKRVTTAVPHGLVCPGR